jgi:hypothetical protein
MSTHILHLKKNLIVLRVGGLRVYGEKTGYNHRKISDILSTSLPRNTLSRNKLRQFLKS